MHIIILRGYPLELIRAVILGYKNVLSEANSHGLLPLHVALSSKRDDDIIHFLLEENLWASAIATSNGDLPIHIVLRNGTGTKVINELIVVPFLSTI